MHMDLKFATNLGSTDDAFLEDMDEQLSQMSPRSMSPALSDK